MNATCTSLLNRHSLRNLGLIASFTFLAAATPLAQGRTRIDDTDAPSAPIMMASTTDSLPDLPDAPEPNISTSLSSSVDNMEADPAFAGSWQLGFSSRSDAQLARRPASPFSKYVLPHQRAPQLTTKDKVAMGFLYSATPYSILGWIVSSGYTHVTDGSPNYGVDKGAYGQRLGAAALRGFSEEVFSDSLMAPLLHQDPRYYKLGRGHSVAARTLYSVSRALITRNDDGQLAPNYSLMAGNLLGAALTNAYYPPINRSAGQTARTFGTTMGGSAISFFASEFVSGWIETIRLRVRRDRDGD